MRGEFFSRYKFFVCAAFFLVATVVSFYAAALSVSNVGAVSLSNGYFFGRPAPGPAPYNIDYPVVFGGIPVFTTKQEFLDYIYVKYQEPLGSSDKLAASYIIQTMRGLPAGSAIPGDAEFNDWVARVNNPAVTFDFGSYNNDQNSARFYDKTQVYEHKRDITEYKGDGVAYFSMRFYYNGSLVYVIKKVCANPLGKKAGLPVPTNYNLIPSETSDTATGYAGTPYNIFPSINNNGTTSSSNTEWRFTRFTVPEGSPVPSGGDNNNDPVSYYSNGATVLDVGTGASFVVGVTPFIKKSQTIPDLPGGTKVCYGLSVKPYNQSTTDWRHGPPVCVVVAKRFTLTPSTTSTRAYGEAGSQFQINSYVNNTGNAATTNTEWQLSQFTVTPGGSVPAGADNDLTPAAYFRNGTLALDGATGVSFPLGTTAFNPKSLEVPDAVVGTKVCYALSVKPFNQITTNWRHSSPTCVTVSKSPKTQIYGSDLQVGRLFSGSIATVPTSKVQTSVTNKTPNGSQPNMFGSWGEYGILATGAVKGMASGSAYGKGVTTITSCMTAMLTIANTPDTGPCSSGASLGGYKTNKTMPDVASYFPTSSTTPTLPVSTGIGSLNGTFKAPANLTITGGNVTPGQSIIINAPNSVVTITGDITYVGANLTSIDKIPQMVIIAKDIKIAGSVTNIDSWLIATGAVTTCSDVATINQLTANVCGKTLTVNGPVMAGQLLLWRTGGSNPGAAAGDPAEIFNLRPDAYLWGIAHSYTSRVKTVYETELPPRF